MLSVDQVDDLSLRVLALEDSSREVDCLIMLAMLGRQTANPRIVTLLDNETQPLCMTWDEPILPSVAKRMTDDGQEVLNFEYDGRWYHFVSRVTLPLTSSIDACKELMHRATPEFTSWSLKTHGDVYDRDPKTGEQVRRPPISEVALWGSNPGLSSNFQNKIDAVAFAGAILRTQYFKLRDFNERVARS